MANSEQRDKSLSDNPSEKSQKHGPDQRAARKDPPIQQVNPDHEGLNPDHLGPAQPRKPEK